MKISGKSLYAYYIHICLMKSPRLNPRPEHLAGMNDDLPAKVCHYIWDLGLEGGQRVMRAFTDLSLNYAPHEIIYGVAIWWAGRPHFLQPVVRQNGLQPMLGLHSNGDILRVRTQLSVILAVCLFILDKILLIREENYFVWIRWFSSGARRFWHSCNSCEMFLKIKTVFLHDVIPETSSFPMRPAKNFYDKPWPR